MPFTLPDGSQTPYAPSDIEESAPSNTLAGVYVTTTTVSDPASLPSVAQMQDPPSGMLLGYGQEIDYSANMGIAAAVPADASGTPVEIIQTDAGACVKTITAVVLAVGYAPPVPSRDTGSSNDRLAHWRVRSFSPGRTLDGSKVYGIIVRYVYILLTMPGPNDVLDMGSTPMDTDTPAVNVLQPYQWVKNLTQASTVTGN